jgi:glycine oxidase
VVPRTEGPDAGRVVIGATVEDCGFDLEVHALDILTLHARAARLVPALATAEFLEGWSGLRPGTTDGLPILGALARQPRYLLANGAFRNGILLAPAIARVIAEVIAGRLPAIDLTAFRPERF